MCSCRAARRGTDTARSPLLAALRLDLIERLVRLTRFKAGAPPGHLAAEMLKRMAGIDMKQVAYQGKRARRTIWWVGT
jgi:hypothetical protein